MQKIPIKVFHKNKDSDPAYLGDIQIKLQCKIGEEKIINFFLTSEDARKLSKDIDKALEEANENQT